jgi:hypothetical protein
MKKSILAVLFILAIALPAAAQTTFTLNPPNPAPGQTVTLTIQSRWPDSCFPTFKEVRVVGRTVIVESEVTGCEVRLCAAVAVDYTITATFTAPSGSAPFDIEYYADVCGNRRTLLATTTVPLSGVCDFGHSLVASQTSIRVGDRTTLRWCNPATTTPDNAFTVTGYGVFFSSAPDGPFREIVTIQGATTTSVELTATTFDIGTSYFYVEARGCTTTITGQCVPATLLSNIVNTTVSAANGCAPNATTLCLGNGRFQVTARWRAPNNANGDGRPVQLTRDSGHFWFFDEENVEVTVKVLDACPSSYWVFASGMTNVEVELKVVDTKNNVTKTYTNPQGMTFQTKTDTSAFACP